jgi:hypothetical protein
MATKSMTGAGLSVTIGGAAIGQVKSAQFSGAKWAMDDITNAASPAAGSGVLKEETPTVLDVGTLEIGGIWVYNDPGQQALITNFNNGSSANFVVTLQKGEGQATTGTSFTFSGYVQSPPYPDISFDKALTWKASINISTAVTVGYGS